MKILFEQKIASPNQAMIICIVDGKVIGNCEISFFKGIKTKHRAIVVIALIRKYCNQGIGTKMFQEMIRLAETRGCYASGIEFCRRKFSSKAFI